MTVNLENPTSGVEHNMSEFSLEIKLRGTNYFYLRSIYWERVTPMSPVHPVGFLHTKVITCRSWNGIFRVFLNSDSLSWRNFSLFQNFGMGVWIQPSKEYEKSSLSKIQKIIAGAQPPTLIFCLNNQHLCK